MIPEVEQRQVEIEALCRRFRVRRLDLFGSAADGSFRPDESDLDFLVEFESPGEPGYSGRFFGFKEALESLFARPVDLVVESAITNPYFRKAVEESRKGRHMPRDPRVYLYDIQQASASLLEFTAGRDFAEYERDRMLRRAVEREFEIIGEALSQLARVDDSVSARISDYRQIIGFRNALIHGYRDIDHEAVWRTIEDDLPRLMREVVDLLAEA